MAINPSMSGRVVIVTGSARGRGREIALQFARLGANVSICDIGRAALATVEYPLSSAGELDEVAEEIRPLGVRVVARVSDIRDQQHVDDLIRGARGVRTNRFAVHNAGILSRDGRRPEGVPGPKD